MDPNKFKNQDGTNRHDEAPTDAPPSYSEAMKNPPYQDVSYSTPRPTAPALETNSTNPNNTYSPAQFPQPGDPNYNVQNNQNFQKWDAKATRILIINRLQMNNQFNNAKTSWEEDLLWNILMNNLMDCGYHFSIIDIIRFWEFQFHIYKSIINSLTGGTHSSDSTNWEYFQPMNNVFGSHGVSNVLDTVPTSSTSILPTTPVMPNNPIVPITTPLPPAQEPIATALQSAEVPSTTLPNPSPPVAPSNVTSDGNLASTVAASPAELADQVSGSERTPLLVQSNGDANNLQPDALLNSGSNVPEASTLSPLPTESLLQTSSVSEVPAGAGDHFTSIKGSFIESAGSYPSEATSNLLNDSSTKLNTITTQPQDFSITKFIEDNNDVVTSQPTHSATMLPMTSTTATTIDSPNDNGADDCCYSGPSCCCWTTHHHHYGLHSNQYRYGTGGDGCCDGGDGCCDSGGDGCCDGGGDGCCDGGGDGCCEEGGDCDCCDGCDADC